MVLPSSTQCLQSYKCGVFVHVRDPRSGLQPSIFIMDSEFITEFYCIHCNVSLPLRPQRKWESPKCPRCQNTIISRAEENPQRLNEPPDFQNSNRPLYNLEINAGSTSSQGRQNPGWRFDAPANIQNIDERQDDPDDCLGDCEEMLSEGTAEHNALSVVIEPEREASEPIHGSSSEFLAQL